MSLSLSDFFVLASVLQGVFIGLALLCAPFFRSKANNYLAVFILLLSLITFLGWQEFDNFWVDYVWSFMWEFLPPPVLFLYFLLVLDHPYLKALWLPWLFAPFLLTFFFDLAIGLDFAFGLYRLPFTEEHPAWQLYDALEDRLSMWYNVLMVGWALYLSRTDTTLPPQKRQWLIRFSTAMLLVLGVWFLSDLVHVSTEIENPSAAIWLALSLLFWWICYAGVYQLRILDDRTEINELLSLKARRAVPAPVAVTNAVENGYAPRLRDLLHGQQLFRNPDLGRGLVAEHLGISEGYVSQVVQESLGEGFVEYVNGLRVEAAREMLDDPAFAPYSLEAIGQEAGFKSRSAFYTTFKKATSVTPGAYRKGVKTS